MEIGADGTPTACHETMVFAKFHENLWDYYCNQQPVFRVY
jgi:hypothetical protein